MKNYSRNLREKYMSRLARVFKIDEISQQLVGQIPWFTLVVVEILYKSKSYEEMQLNKERNIKI